jgi:CRISPR system Cascade subunit CasC
MIVELHLLQSFPVSNLNRDDLGQPKTATFGGVTRARISSQSLKRAARRLFTKYGLNTTEVGIRTKRIVDEVVPILGRAGKDEEQARTVAMAALRQLGFGVNKDSGLTQYLLFVSHASIDFLARYCDDNWESLKRLAAAKTTSAQNKIKADRAAVEAGRRILDAGRAADVALFGRMIADNADFNVNAASQVAHAISTHAVTTEFDYFTAVDDLKPNDTPGAEMIGSVDFNAACYYRYANVDIGQLSENLSGDDDLVARTVRAWLYAFINAVPGGKQNSTAALTMPDTLLGVVRSRGAWNLANAFLKPVVAEDLMSESTDRMLWHFGRLKDFYGGESGEIRSAVAASVSGDIATNGVVSTADSVDTFVRDLLAAAEV